MPAKPVKTVSTIADLTSRFLESSPTPRDEMIELSFTQPNYPDGDGSGRLKAYIFQRKEHDDTDWTNADSWTYKNNGTLELHEKINWEGLDAIYGHTYDFRVQTHCSTIDGDIYSKWSNVTTCLFGLNVSTPAPVCAYCKSEDVYCIAPTCWTMYRNGHTSNSVGVPDKSAWGCTTCGKVSFLEMK